MAARVGIDRDLVVDAAVEILDETGDLAAVSLGEVAARVGVRAQSLYAHVDGIDGLRRALALRGLDALARRLSDAAIGRAGRDALAAIVKAWTGFAAERPGLYAASLRAPGDGADVRAAVAATTRPLELVLHAHGLGGAAVTHWVRMVFATVHGFATLRDAGLLTLPASPDRTIDRYVTMLGDQLEAETRRR
jgi:AcrR family transcriptional regulator